MKLALALTLAPVAAFQAPAPAKSASALSAAPIEQWAGNGPFGFFDPLGLSNGIEEQRLQFYREAEIKHGRVAMLASVGFLFQEHFHFDPPLAGGLWFGLALMAGNVEYLSVATFEPLLEGGIIAEQNEDKLFRIKADHKAGDLGFDPLGLKPTSEAELKTMASKELNNGRLAMIGMAGMVAQELVTHAKI
ncbi:chlorophyll A-B binding protein [Aureococcus anophagefferens]|nr:chlorophyll A-B binding protein [Aureococcus anophagefferens]